MKLKLFLDTSQPEAIIILKTENQEFTFKKYFDRLLARDFLRYLEELLNSNNYSWHDIEGIGVFSGPGSFTGLRIGLTIANTLADGLEIPIVGTDTKDWMVEANQKLIDGINEKIVLPNYGSEPKITQPK